MPKIDNILRGDIQIPKCNMDEYPAKQFSIQLNGCMYYTRIYDGN